MGSTGIKRTMYLSIKKDKDIIDVITPLMENYDFSFIMRELARDGIKYRQGAAYQPLPVVMDDKVGQRHTPLAKMELAGNLLGSKKEPTDTDLEDRLNSF